MSQLSFDFETRQPPRAAIRSGRGARGLRAYLSGCAAEDAALRAYQARGARLLERRWRGTSGEIDLILRDPESYVFCEVKKATSFDIALQRIRQGQVQRIFSAASEYLGHTPEGQLAPVRFDLVLVNGMGDLRLMENALGHF
ncbi:YraN family protein [uncultured Roseovarius sp.]|uniref:YraN family protein n=1 Tax=uncultured Roseovarius sp. TaxID=293344 RepID=UPI0026130CAA|nr:YraN family protein [uncultured Roseovarius sp.]